ncbi:hypothetical protein JXR93_12460 [bacterium]|nr:hypothetical protein [bacterium]
MNRLLLITLSIFFITSFLYAEEEKPSIQFKPYGYIELYGIASDTGMVGPELLIYSKDKTKEGFIFNARNSRFGTKITLPSVKNVTLNATMEIDFFGTMADSGMSESRPMPRLRHAFFDIKKTIGEHYFGVIGGQTWSVASMTLFPSMINPGVGWAMGNPWQRLPQIQLYYGKKFGKHVLNFKFSANEPMTGSSLNRGKLLSSDYDAGGSSMMPLLESSLTFDAVLKKFKIFAGVSGSYGKEDYSDYSNGSVIGGKTVDVQMFSGALKVEHPYFAILGKYYMGKNIDIYGVGFGSALAKELKEGSDPATYEIVDSVPTKGFFVDLSVFPFGDKTLQFVFGMGMDDPDEDFDNATVAYNKNSYYLGAIYYTFVEQFKVGVNYMRVMKEASDDIDSNHILLLLRFSF